MHQYNSQGLAPNSQLVVIADDITGAAEIAGIGLDFGLQVSLVMYTKGQDFVPPECDLLVIATDTRSMTESDATEESVWLAQTLRQSGLRNIFKKTDSAIRGHILAELYPLVFAFDFHKALLLPQNPSRKRIIENGRYFIDGKPLDKTPFAHDPEFPARSSYVTDMLRIPNRFILPVGKRPKPKGIYLANASTPEDVMQQAGKLNEKIIPAGGADFFTAFLTSKGYTKKSKPSFNGLPDKDILIVLGSTAKHPIFDFGYFQRNQIPACNTPRFLFYREAPKQWIERIKKIYAEHSSMVLHSNHPPKKGRSFALNLREETGKAVQILCSEFHPRELIIEGGATAFSIMKRLGLDTFHVECEVSPGVIRLIPIANPNITITLKPGSYPWGELFK